MSASAEEYVLIEESLAGKGEAFGEIVAKYQSLVCSVTYNATGDLALSEDLAQETFLVAWQKLSELRDHSKLAPWLCGIARNMARNSVRRRTRDVTHDAAPLDEALASEGTAPVAERIGQSEREAVLWAALEDIPDTYREPLILFYRQGESIRDVAAALDLTEDCVKQRLSRGRKLLKAQLAVFVEKSLADTGPKQAFSATVVAALPALGVSTSASATTGAVVAGKGTATVVSAATLGILLGNIVYLTWGFFGMWTAIRDAHTLRARRYALKTSALAYTFFWAFTGLQGMNGTLFWRTPPLMFTAIGVSWATFIVLLFMLVTHTKLRAVQIVEEDLGIRPPPSEAIESSPLSLRRLWRCFAWTSAVTLVGSLAFFLWLHTMPWTNALWGLPVVLLSHSLFVALYLKGVAMSRSEVVFAETAPRASTPQERERAHRRAVFISGAMGLLIAPTLWGLGLGVLATDYTSVIGIGAVIAVVNLIAGWIYSHNYRAEKLVLFWGLTFMGLFIPLVMGLKFPSWAAELGWTMDPAYGWASAAVYFAINGCFAASELVLYLKQTGCRLQQARDSI